MNNNNYSVSRTSNNILSRAFGWMSVGLTFTGLTAFYVAHTPEIVTAIFSNTILVYGLLIAQFGLVMAISFLINRISSLTATALFVLYSVLTGITLSSVFMVYTGASIVLTFAVAASMFAALAIYGFVTKSNLSVMGTFLFMALIGLIVASLLNMFFVNSTFSFLISIAGVAIFALLTAYDVQKIKDMSADLSLDGESANKIAILSALTLYLDFINLFIYLLRLMGQKKK